MKLYLYRAVDGCGMVDCSGAPTVRTGGVLLLPPHLCPRDATHQIFDDETVQRLHSNVSFNDGISRQVRQPATAADRVLSEVGRHAEVAAAALRRRRGRRRHLG